MEISSDRDDVSVYFTVDGSRPDPFGCENPKSTFRYEKPFLLPPGEWTIRALHRAYFLTEYDVLFYLQELKKPKPALHTLSDFAKPREVDVNLVDELILDADYRSNSTLSRDSPEPNTLGASHKVPEATMVTCGACSAIGPLENGICIVCSKPYVSGELRPTTERVVCRMCHSLNRPDCAKCSTCHADMKQEWQVVCRNCGHEEARLDGVVKQFCTKCGTENVTSTKSACVSCNSLNDNSAKYCIQCGASLQSPRTNSPSMRTRTMARRNYSDVASQTVGFYFPSSLQMSKQEEMLRQRSARMSPRGNDMPKFLTPISPGRGFWRRQLDHVFAHTKIYTANNAEFRADVGYPRMGKLVFAKLDTDDESGDVLIMLRFENHLVNNKESEIRIETFSPVSRDQLPPVEVTRPMRGSAPAIGFVVSSEEEYSFEEQEEEEEYVDSGSGEEEEQQVLVARRKNMSRPKVAKRNKKRMSLGKNEVEPGDSGMAHLRVAALTEKDKELINYLRQDTSKKIHSDKLLELAHAGANLNCYDASGHTPLGIAIATGRKELIPSLVQLGANINIQSSIKFVLANISYCLRLIRMTCA
ncbi:double zinc ribbon and ankyrin repeat domains 1 [Cichlidogyrus casuarinus]|uniref:Double zinc ribbon and ankyrin repeat domains 1 n=1 Tax=Cichlidogyrus casuarinus TaxID=1844966 RepID=A0ABD2QCX7_9PLAT